MNKALDAPRWPPLVLLLAVFLLLASLRSTAVSIPLQRDEGEYAYIAQRWLLGVPPYLESFDQKPPGVFLFYLLTFVTCGQSTEAIHWAQQFYTFGTLGILFLLGCKVGDPYVGVLAAFYCGFAVGHSSVQGVATNTEVIMILPMTASFLVTLRAVETGRCGWPLAAGALSAAAVLCKQPAIVNLVYNLFLVILCSRFRLRASLLFLAGSAVIVIPTIAYFAAYGALYECWDCVIGYNLYYSSSIPLRSYAATFLGAMRWQLRHMGPIIYALAGVGLFWELRPAVSFSTRPVRRNGWLLAGWLLASVGGVSIAGTFREHYLIQLMPAVSLLAALGTRAVNSRLPVHFQGLATAMIAGAVLLWGILCAPGYYAPFKTAVELERESRRLYDVNPFSDAPAAAHYVAERTTPDESIYVLGAEPQIFFYARRSCVGRYIFIYPLMNPYPGVIERQREVIRELESKRPRYILRATVYPPIDLQEGAGTMLVEYVRQLLERDYRLVAATRYDLDMRLVSEEAEPDRFQEVVKDNHVREKLCSLLIYQRLD